MIALGKSIYFEAGKTSPLDLRNFHLPEDGYVWSYSTWCEIVFPFDSQSAPLPKICDLILDVDVFRAPPELPHQPVMFYLNGMRIGQYDVDRQQTLVIAFPATLLQKQLNTLVVDTPSSKRPALFGIPDERILGLKLFSAQIQPA